MHANIRLTTILMTLVLVIPARIIPAGTITQVISGREGAHNTSYTPYYQFDPKIGTLTSVSLSFTQGVASTNNYTFFSFLDHPVTSLITINSFLICGDKNINLTQTYLDVFQPGQQISHKSSVIFTSSSSYTGNLTRWIGTGDLTPDTYIGGLFGFTTCDTPGISMINDQTDRVSYLETITYTYHTPAPGSLIMLATGLLNILLLSGRQPA